MSRLLLRAGFGLAVVAVWWGSVVPLPAPPVPGADKLVHFGVFALLAGGALAAWPRQRFLLPVLLALYGLALEVAQSFVPARQFSWADWGADLAGIGVVMLAARLAMGMFRERVRNVSKTWL